MVINPLSILERQENETGENEEDGGNVDGVTIFLIFITIIVVSRIILIIVLGILQKCFVSRTDRNNSTQQNTSSSRNIPQSTSLELPMSPTTPPIVVLQPFQSQSRFRGYSSQSYSSRRSVRTNSIEDFDDLNSFVVENHKKEESCPVCLEPFDDQPVSTGQCLHLCHTTCMKSWLAKDTTVSCPVCRVTLHDAVSVHDTLKPKSHTNSRPSASDDHTPSTLING